MKVFLILKNWGMQELPKQGSQKMKSLKFKEPVWQLFSRWIYWVESYHNLQLVGRKTGKDRSKFLQRLSYISKLNFLFFDQMLLHDFCLTEVSEFPEKQISDSLCHLRFRWFLEISSSVGRLCKIYKCLLNNCHILWNIWYFPSQIWGCRSSVLLKDLSCSVL